MQRLQNNANYYLLSHSSLTAGSHGTVDIENLLDEKDEVSSPDGDGKHYQNVIRVYKNGTRVVVRKIFKTRKT